MRHGKRFNHLSRTNAHRKAMFANMASSLIMHKRIKTTVAKAKALRSYIEPLITKSKDDSTHSRRTVFGYLQNKEAVNELFRDISVKVAERPGGYTRILKLAPRPGDNASMCLIELVDYNEHLLAEKQERQKTRKTRRGRRGSGKGKTESTETTAHTEATENKATPEASTVATVEETAPETQQPAEATGGKPKEKKAETKQDTEPGKEKEKPREATRENKPGKKPETTSEDASGKKADDHKTEEQKDTPDQPDK